MFHEQLLGLSSRLTGAQKKPFRLLDLPAEIRNRVYEYTLSSFPDDVHIGTMIMAEKCTGEEAMKLLASKELTINTALLCTNKQVYREAYDVLIKKNEFVHIKFGGGARLPQYLVSCGIPIFYTNRDHTIRAGTKTFFTGAVMTVQISNGNYRVPEVLDADAKLGGPASFLVRGKDFPFAWRVIPACGDWLPNIMAALNVVFIFGPEHLPQHRLCDDTMRAYLGHEKFNELANSLMNFDHPELGFHGLKFVAGYSHYVQPGALTDIATALAVCGSYDAKEFESTIHQNLVHGIQYYAEGKMHAAAMSWIHGVVNIRIVLRNRLYWKLMVDTTGFNFIDSIGDKAFRLCLLLLSAELLAQEYREHGNSDHPLPVSSEFKLPYFHNEHFLEDMRTTKDRWCPFYKYIVSERLLAQFLWLYAWNERSRVLQYGDTSGPEVVPDDRDIYSLEHALHAIDKAIELDPDVEVFKLEKQNIEALYEPKVDARAAHSKFSNVVLRHVQEVLLDGYHFVV